MKTKVLLAVVGPTAIGKTSWAIRIAKHFETEIVSADSRQFYKEMQIGTAVPEKNELETVKHHFIQHKSVFEPYSVGDYEKDATKLLEKLFAVHDVVVLVGGSGLYVDAVVNGLDNFPEVDPKIRQALIEQWQSEGLEKLQDELKALDILHYQNVDLENPHRIIRALEICRTSGKPYSSFLGKKTINRPFETVYLGIQASREIVYERIEQRVDAMVANGLLDEAKTLLPHKNLNALQTVGYKELFEYFEGHCSLEEAITEIKKNTRRYAKRQLTWYRKKEDIIRVDHDASENEATKKIEVKINSFAHG